MAEKITTEQFQNHDCKLSSEDSCATCEVYFNQSKGWVDETCSMCGGEGVIQVGEFDGKEVMLPHALCVKLNLNFGKKLTIMGFDSGASDIVTVQMTEVEKDMLGGAVEFLSRAGFAEVQKYLISVAILAKGVLGKFFDGKIYIGRDTFSRGRKMLVETVFEEYVHGEYEVSDKTRSMQDRLINIAVGLMEEKTNKHL